MHTKINSWLLIDRTTNLNYWHACSLEHWSFEILVLLAGLLPQSQLSTSIIAMW